MLTSQEHPQKTIRFRFDVGSYGDVNGGAGAIGNQLSKKDAKIKQCVRNLFFNKIVLGK